METHQRILILEEDLPLKQTLSHIFRRAGYQVFSSPVDLSALDLLDGSFFDLVMLDTSKNHDRALSLFFRIKRYYPQLPVIFLLSGPDCDTIPGLEEEDLWVRITKPFDPFDLLRITREMISASADQIELTDRVLQGDLRAN